MEIIEANVQVRHSTKEAGLGVEAMPSSKASLVRRNGPRQHLAAARANARSNSNKPRVSNLSEDTYAAATPVLRIHKVAEGRGTTARQDPEVLDCTSQLSQCLFRNGSALRH
eukprot:scaffold127738_cov30-Tisochrysis_lutea.AAC.4